MATTNTNTSNDTSLSTDIYEISDFIDSIRRDNIPDVDDTASILGIFGWANEIFSQTLQNTLIAISETSNETIATRAKFSKNVISHALNLGINKIMATPAVMTLMIYLPESQVEENFEYDSNGNATFTFDKNIPIYVDKYEYHVDYDIIIKRTPIPGDDKKYVYSAMYDLFEDGTTVVKQNNPISDITNPYITTMAQYTIDDIKYLAFSVRVHQVSNVYETRDILTDNSIENKTVTFEFTDQLAAFDVDVVESDDTKVHLTPIYDGLLDYTVQDNWCYYEYIDEYTIRIIFDRDSYVPPVNSKVTINIKISEGASGNFTYNENFKLSLISEERNNYNGMYMLIYPLLDGTSAGGKDKKSIAELKKIIPREASSRGSVINTTDLQNFFNSIDDDECKLYFFKKRDNPFERLYYSYMLFRKDSYVYPTNTINLKIMQDDFVGFSGNNNLVIRPGTVFYYYDHGTDVDNDYASVIEPNDMVSYDPYKTVFNSDGNERRVYEYVSPFLISVDDDLITSYLLTTMNDNKAFKFDKINTSSDLQFIATSMNWKRKFIYYDDDGNKCTYDNKYTMDISMTQNNTIDYGLVKYHYDENGDMAFDDVRVSVYMVLYNDDTDLNPYRYTKAELIEYDPMRYIYDFRFTMETDDLMDLTNRINIKNIKNAKGESIQSLEEAEVGHGYLNNNTYARIYIMADFGVKVGDTLSDGKIAEKDEIIIYGEDGCGNRIESKFNSVIPTRDDIIQEFLRNNISISKNGETVDMVYIMRHNENFVKVLNEYYGGTKAENLDEKYILNFITRNSSSDFVQNELLQDELSIEVIESYNYEAVERYTVCNTFVIDGGIDFYYDYSNIMSSVVNVARVPKLDSNGEQVYKGVIRTDSYGNSYTEYIKIYEVSENNTPFYNYTLNRIPVIKNGYLNEEDLMEEFVYDLEERRKYINICLDVLEDTFAIDLKFFNTYGPSRKFYYSIPSATEYAAKVIIPTCNVYQSANEDADVLTTINMGDSLRVTSVSGIWAYAHTTKRTADGGWYEGYVKLDTISRDKDYIDNVALTMEFALETHSSSDKYIVDSIVTDIKEYIEDINEINELHIPNIITLITNNYREQLVYFEFMGVNNYSSACQHLYLNEETDVEICPEFLNIATREDDNTTPDITITAY